MGAVHGAERGLLPALGRLSARPGGRPRPAVRGGLYAPGMNPGMRVALARRGSIAVAGLVAFIARANEHDRLVALCILCIVVLVAWEIWHLASRRRAE